MMTKTAAAALGAFAAGLLFPAIPPQAPVMIAGASTTMS
jgi:hypothetical protein